MCGGPGLDFGVSCCEYRSVVGGGGCERGGEGMIKGERGEWIGR